jgi:hypothetical protein
VPAEALRYRRAIWGKVHGEASDYRWIARAGEFAQGAPDLAGALRLGAEDIPVSAPLWRRLPDRYLAVAVYPSRARDSAGRMTVIEKQVFEWPVSAAVPAALAALALLPEVARFDDTDWWERRGQGDWAAPDYALPIDAADQPPIDVDARVLDGRVQDGVAALTGVTAPADLRAFYVQLLAGRFPARLRVSSPLSPTALAVLLLPLPRYWADRLSLAGGIAARHIATRDLMRNWDGFASDLPSEADASDAGQEITELADTMAAALLQLRQAPGVDPDPGR